MCTMWVQTEMYSNEVQKHEYESSTIRLWCKIICKIGVEQIKNSVKKTTSIYTLFRPSLMKYILKCFKIFQINSRCFTIFQKISNE